jgi:hypothetical protein
VLHFDNRIPAQRQPPPSLKVVFLSQSMKSRRLAIVLLVIFSIALLLGPGPGHLLINPDADAPEARRFFLGLPIVYAWALLWFFVQAACIVVAYFTLWREPAQEEK